MIDIGLSDFNRVVDDFCQKAPEQIVGDVVRRLGMYGLRGLVRKTPVKTGRARLLSLAERSKIEGREPPKWFMGAIKRSEAEGSFSYQPRGRRPA